MIFAQVPKMREGEMYPHPFVEKLGGDEVPKVGEADPAVGGTSGGPRNSDEVRGGAGGEEWRLGVGGVRGALMRPSPRSPCRYRLKPLRPDNLI